MTSGRLLQTFRVWDWQRKRTPLADANYGSDSYGASWSQDGRLATSSFDGKLRLYRLRTTSGQASLQKLPEQTAPGGKQPFAVAFAKDDAWGNGALTKAVVEGLQGGADYKKTGRITHKMLDLYISERVKELTKGKQSPVTQAPGGVQDFPLVILGEGGK